jgi:hypothetical protein
MEMGLSHCVTAFRPKSGKSNIDHAGEVFEWIRNCGEGRAYAFDITSFFDRLDHPRLKAGWETLIGVTRLPSDHFAVFKSLTSFSFVHRNAAFEALKVSRHNPRAGNRRRLCPPSEFRELIRAADLIGRNDSGMGIPQGSPMSAVLSNIYMLEFDEAMAAWVTERGGIYRRYCDDILVAVPVSCSDDVAGFVQSKITDLALEIQPEKTTEHQFQIIAEKVQLDRPLSYLGFVFDGSRVLIRTVGISRYYAKMRSGVRLAGQTMRKHNSKGKPHEPMRTRKLYVLYSYVGRHNFTSYAYRAARDLKSPAIKKQIRRHWSVLKEEIKNSSRKYKI